MSRPPLIHHRGRTHTMLAATARRSSSVFRGAARVTGTRHFAVRLAAHTHATPRAALERVAPRLNVSFATFVVDIRDDGARARDDDDVASAEDAFRTRPRLASRERGISPGRTPLERLERASLTSTPPPPGSTRHRSSSPRNSRRLLGATFRLSVARVPPNLSLPASRLRLSPTRMSTRSSRARRRT